VCCAQDRVGDGPLKRHDDSSQTLTDRSASQPAIWRSQAPADGAPAPARDGYGFPRAADRAISTHEFPTLSATAKNPQLKPTYRAPAHEVRRRVEG